MSIKASVFIATSLDGYISRTDGSIDWLIEANNSTPSGEDCGYQVFIDTVDLLVMGRNTFDQVVTFEKWPYEKPVLVLTSRPLEIPPSLATCVSTSSEKPAPLMQRLNKEGIKHIYVDGGLTIQNFLVDNLIDTITITIIPVLLGDGRPLFGSLPKDISLTLTDTKTYDFGFMQMTYQVNKS